jgi:cytochrome b6-f complex iron-sulfur subunit
MTTIDRFSDGERSPLRRRILRWLWGGSLVALTAEFVGMAASFLRPRPAPAGSEMAGLVVVGPIDSFDPGSVTAVPSGRFYLVRLEDGGFLAVRRECTHLGCTVPWSSDERRFACPCHSSAFDITGAVLHPPATRPLDLYRVRVENGIVKVDVSRPLRRSRFEASQVTRI